METKLRFFDCNCSIGRTGYPLLLDISDTAGLWQEMKTAGIEEALVYHTVARDAHPPLGNALLLEEIKNWPALHPVWILLPHHTGEMPPPEQWLGEMKTRGIQAVRAYPTKSYHGYSLSEWCAGELLAALEKARLPLILDAEISGWEDVWSLLKSYPRLPLIMANCSYRHNRVLYPLFEKFTNIFIETSRFMGGGAVEDIVARFGARPLVFGTNMPQYTGTAAVALITYADIDPKDKEAIAGGNLRRLLGEAWP